MKRKCIFLVVLVLLFSFTACSSKIEMPMEISIDGFNIVLGQTKVTELVEAGYDANFVSSPASAKKGDKYIPFNLSLDKGAGHQLFVTVCVPWSGSNNISTELSTVVQNGIIKSVTVTNTSTAKVETVYNGVNIQNLTFDYAIENWQAKEKTDASRKTYSIYAKQGYIELTSSSSTDKEFSSLDIQMSQNEFDKMQAD